MMSIKQILILTILLLSFFVDLKAQNRGFIFFDDTFENLKTRGNNANKPYFVYLYANWSTHAKKSNESTFKDPTLAKYAQANYIGMKLDGESSTNEGKKISNVLNVLYHPVIIIFTPQGKEVERVYGYLSPAKLLALLQKHRYAIGKPDNTKNIAAETFGKDMDEGYDPNEDGYLLQVAAKVLPLTGWGVQVGIFNHYRTAFIKIIELGEKRFHKNVLAYVNEGGKEKVYKIVLGPFKTQQEAENYRNALRKKEPDLPGIVVDLSVIE